MKMFFSLITYAAGFVLVWNVLDFLFCTFITQSDYAFSIGADMIAPLTLTLIIRAVELTSQKKARA